MLILHANWSDDRLHLWGEVLSRFMAVCRGDGSRGEPCGRDEADAPVVAVHPFAADHDTICAAVARFGIALEDEPARGRLCVRLPAAGSTPNASEQLTGLVDAPLPRDRPMLVEFSVPSCRMGAGGAFDFLLAARFGDASAGVECGPGLRFLADLAAFVSELLINQRYIPTLVQRAMNELEGSWAPWLDDDDTLARMRSLFARIPPAARAAIDQWHHQPWAVVDSFVHAVTDAVVRRTVVADRFADALIAGIGVEDRHVALLRGLLAPSPAIDSNAAVAAQLYEGMRRWIGRLDVGGDGAPARLCVRLHEPAPEPEQQIDGDGDPPAWTLTLHLRVEGADALLADVEDLWRPALGGAIHGAQAMKLQETALREIRRAGELYEPLEATLDAPVPRPLSLSIVEAYDFLREGAPLLRDAGIEVITPSWWDDASGRLGVRLLLDPIAADRPDHVAVPRRLGMDSLVSYSWQVVIGEENLSLDEFERLAHDRAPLVRFKDRWIEMRPADLVAAEDLFQTDRSGAMTVRDALQAVHGFGLASPDLPVAGIEASGWLGELLDGQGDGRLRAVVQPGAFRGTLRGYQRAGLSWLAFLEQFGLGGCLADDMGLGKTIQLIALLLHEREEATDPDALGPTLVIAPLSVVTNWARELARFAPELRVMVHHGPDRRTGDAFFTGVASVDVVVTTYGLVMRDLDTLRRTHWHRVVVDEAQNIKNAPTKQAQAIRSLPATRRIAMTGTPVENRLSELWSIMDFCNPGYLGAAPDFRRRFEIPIERRRDRRRADVLRGLIRPFILRRLKTDRDVLPELPDLVSTKQYAALTAEQTRLYRDVVHQMLRQVDDADGMRRRGLILAGIVRLKQICNHPANLPDHVRGLAVGNGEGGPGLSETPALVQRSGKVGVLVELLDEVLAAGDQALIFTQFRRMGDLLVRMIRHEFDVPVQFLHGGVSASKRQEMIDRFQDDALHTPILVLSLRAGGVGLNLTAANHVFHFDRWWNPAVENQATDRAFRIGQRRTVQVHKLICSGTIEEQIDQMIEEKTKLADQIVGTGDAWLTELSSAQLRDLVTLREGALAEDGI